MLHCDLRVRWKVASDLRFRAAISEAETPSFCRISGDLAPSTRKSLAITIVRLWCAKLCSQLLNEEIAVLGLACKKEISCCCSSFEIVQIKESLTTLWFTCSGCAHPLARAQKEEIAAGSNLPDVASIAPDLYSESCLEASDLFGVQPDIFPRKGPMFNDTPERPDIQRDDKQSNEARGAARTMPGSAQVRAGETSVKMGVAQPSPIQWNA